jgi:dolichol-phosphate mannosyltransferase
MNKQIHNKIKGVPDYISNEIKEKNSDYCLCIPVINEGDRLINELKKINALKYNIDVIICDGGSTDDSVNIETLKRQGVNTLLIKTGGGKLSAQLRMGFNFALSRGYKGVITIDGNDKDDPAEIKDFMVSLDDGYDFIQGSRFVRGGAAVNTPLIRLFAIRFLHAPIVSLSAGFWYTDTTNGFRGHSQKLLSDRRLSLFRSVFNTYEILPYLSTKSHRMGFRTIEIPVKRIYPKNEAIPTKISPFKGNIDLFKILINNSLGAYDEK